MKSFPFDTITRTIEVTMKIIFLSKHTKSKKSTNFPDELIVRIMRTRTLHEHIKQRHFLNRQLPLNRSLRIKSQNFSWKLCLDTNTVHTSHKMRLSCFEIAIISTRKPWKAHQTRTITIWFGYDDDEALCAMYVCVHDFVELSKVFLAQNGFECN